LIWSERERAGREYFEKKWARLRYVERFEELIGRAGERKGSRTVEVST
jgi:hypothetical protein